MITRALCICIYFKLIAITHAADQWQTEDRFCSQLQNISLCQCDNSDNNRLAIDCAKTHLINAFDANHQLEATLKLLERFNEGGNNLDVESLVIDNLTELTTLHLRAYPRLGLTRIALINLPKLEQFNVGTALHETLASIVIFNTSLSLHSIVNEVFDDRFRKLHTVLLSTAFNQNETNHLGVEFGSKKCSTIRLLSLNHDCLPEVRLSKLPSGMLRPLCNIEALDLSCLGLDDIGELSNLNAPRRREDYNHRRVFIDLRGNDLSPEAWSSIHLRIPADVHINEDTIVSL